MDEVWTAIIVKLKANEDFADLVKDRIWYGVPRSAVTEFPAVRLLLIGSLPNMNIPGDYVARLQIDVTAQVAGDGWPVVRAIEDVLRHPTRENIEPIETENYWVRGMLPGNTASIDSVKSGAVGQLVQLSTDWTLKITRK